MDAPDQPELPEMPDLAGMPIMTTHAEVRDALRDQRLSARSFTDDMVASGISTTVAHQLTPLFRRSGEEHRAHRALLSAAFTPRSVERLRPVAARIAARLADEIAAGASTGPDGPGPAGVDDAVTCELVEAFAAPLPPEVFAHLFGLPLQDRDRLAGWASTVTLAFLPGIGADEVAAVEAACGELRAYAEAQIARRKAEPGDDLVSRLLAAEVDGARLDEEDVIATITGFISPARRPPGVSSPRPSPPWPRHPTCGGAWPPSPKPSPKQSRRCCGTARSCRA